MSDYMLITCGNGLTIWGDVRIKGHEGWIALESLQLGPAAWSSGSGGAPLPVNGKGEIVVTKRRDAASASLFQQQVFGSPARVQIDRVELRQHSRPVTTMRLTLEDARISNYGVVSDRITGPLETVSIDFQRMTRRTFTPATSP